MAAQFTSNISLALGRLQAHLASGDVSPPDVVTQVYAAIREREDPAIFVHLLPERDAARRAQELARTPERERGPLHGVPFAVKDNIDVEGLPTTAACPEFRYVARRTAPAVQKLLDAGAVLVGKTNLDQFATGLVGTRSPYGIPQNPFDAAYIPGGSSSGSAVAVAAGLVSFALGTDTAGSGRVPAAMNNVVGIKPTRGVISTRGVVPACRAQDCVSVFTGDVADGMLVLRLMAGPDPEDVYSRPSAHDWDPTPLAHGRFRFGVPAPDQLVFHDSDTAARYHAAAQQLSDLGGHRVEIDFAPFAAAARMLYGSALVAQRLEAAGEVYAQSPAALHPAVAEILERASSHGALDVHRAAARLHALWRESLATWRAVHLLLLPTIPGPLTVERALADPMHGNAALGVYTNFVNLLDLCAVAVPAGFGADGVPRGVSLVAPAGEDGLALGVASALHPLLCTRRGATSDLLGSMPELRKPAVRIAVAGAHMEGMPLNHQLLEVGARLLERTATAPRYRLFALATTPPKPGLVRVAEGEPGHAVEVETWALSSGALGQFVAALPPPMCIGRVELANGEHVIGFLVEPHAARGARDISALGGWRRYLNDR